MLDCRQVSRMLSEAQERPLRAAERLRLHAHLLVCKGCMEFRRQLDFLRTAAKRLPDRDDPPR